jgi:hypothetical protein
VEVLFESIAGSRLYGLHNDQSDTDFTRVYIPSLRDLLLNKYPDTIDTGTGTKYMKNKATDTDTLSYALPFFVRKAATGKQQFIDALHSDVPTITSPIWTELISIRHKFYSKNMANAVEFIDRQIYSYGNPVAINAALEEVLKEVEHWYDRSVVVDAYVHDFKERLPVNRDCYWVEPFEGGYREIPIEQVTGNHSFFYRANGRLLETSLSLEAFTEQIQLMINNNLKLIKRKTLDAKAWKEVMHALRTGYQALHIVRNGGFTYPLPETDFLLRVRKGELDFVTEVQPIADQLTRDIKYEIANSDLPERVDEVFWEDWLYRTYVKHYKLSIGE